MDGMEVSAIIEYGKEIEPLIERIVGRTALEDIYYPDEPDKIIVTAGEEIDEFKAKEIIDSGNLKVKIRSTLTCETVSGVCEGRTYKSSGWWMVVIKVVVSAAALYCTRIPLDCVCGGCWQFPITSLLH